ncbi:MAG TPA: ABC transporter permease [Candidatus Limnocylindria bacterium]|nr:ABC transporter permease [Candidatus Limnocylindria bacterium]
MLGRRGLLRFLVLPPYLWLAAFLLAPVVLIGIISLRPEPGPINFSREWQPTLEQYGEILGTASYLRQLGISALMALIVGGAATILAYPIAYFLAFRAGDRAPLYLFLLLVPFAVSFLLRVMAWRLMLGSDGAINSFLEWLGVIDEPLNLLIYSRAAVVITLVYVWIPFAALPIYAAMQRIDRRQLEAAADLGAAPWTRFWRVTVPLSAPGAVASFFMVFIPTIGEYVTPRLVGGSETYMYGQLIQDFFGRAASWAAGSAAAVIMLALTVVLVLLATRLVDLRRFAT